MNEVYSSEEMRNDCTEQKYLKPLEKCPHDIISYLSFIELEIVPNNFQQEPHGLPTNFIQLFNRS